MGIEIIGEEKPLNWDEFEALVREDIKNYWQAKSKTVMRHSSWIYRGQSDYSWSLETTLERYLKNELDLDKKKLEQEGYNARKYYQYLAAIVPAINSLTHEQYKHFSYNRLKFKKEKDTVPKYKLMAFARHHGYPTPILDWSNSYYIAAYFAFKDAVNGQNVAIYANKEVSGAGRSYEETEPLIIEQGPYIKSHERHFNQQSIYTACRSVNKGEMYFYKHELAVDINPENHKIKKFIINGDEKDNVLEMLFSMNINDYSLFGNTESLMNMLAFKEFRNL